MSRTIPLRLSSGGRVHVEVADEGRVAVGGGPGSETAAAAMSSLVDVLDVIGEAADDALSSLLAKASLPSRIELAFGVLLTSEFSAVIAKAGAEAQLMVTVVWDRPSGEVG